MNSIQSDVPSAGQVPVTLLTGFLGSGKTTLLNRLLTQSAMSGTAVIINEFGEVGLDDLLLDASERKPVLLKNGCLCCTVRGDLALALQDLALERARGHYRFERVVIETTGLADPAPILHTLMTDPGIADSYRLEGVLTVIDAVHGSDTFDRQPEALKQAAVADRLLLTKQDLADRGTVAALRARLQSLNRGAKVIDATNGDLDASDILGLGLYDPRTQSIDVQKWLRAEVHDRVAYDHHCSFADCRHPSHPRHEDRIHSICLVRDRPIGWESLSAWMSDLGETRFAELLRVKGIVDVRECPGEPVVVHGVHQIFHPPIRLARWPDADHRTRIVLIARDWAMDDAAMRFERLA